MAYVVIIAVVTVGLLGLYRASRDRLDEALGDRLLAVAGSLAVMVDADQIFNYTIGDSTRRPTWICWLQTSCSSAARAIWPRSLFAIPRG